MYVCMHVFVRGLENSPHPETLALQHLIDGQPFPCAYVKIGIPVPLLPTLCILYLPILWLCVCVCVYSTTAVLGQYLLLQYLVRSAFWRGRSICCQYCPSLL